MTTSGSSSFAGTVDRTVPNQFSVIFVRLDQKLNGLYQCESANVVQKVEFPHEVLLIKVGSDLEDAKDCRLIRRKRLLFAAVGQETALLQVNI